VIKIVNGNTILEFEEENIESLMERFIEQYKDEWNEFVLEEFNNKGH